MRRVFGVAVVALALVACKKPEAPPQPPASAQAPAAAPAAPAGQVLRGKVLEKVDVSQYTYLKLGTASGEVWTAVQKADKKVGEEVAVGNAFPMQNFESKELNRKFDVVYFGTLAGPGGEVAALPPAMGAGAPAPGGMGNPPPNMAAQHQAAAQGPSDVKVAKVAKASGADGRTVAEVWKERKALSGKSVSVRGQIVKFTPVMGKNFIHVRDGSGTAEGKDFDLTVTTNDDAAVGDTVLVKGQVTTDKDFGQDYRYGVIVEEAKVVREGAAKVSQK